MVVSEFTKKLTLKKQGRTLNEWEDFLERIKYKQFDLFGNPYEGNENCWYSLFVPAEKEMELLEYRTWADGFKVGMHREHWDAFLSST